MIRSRTPEDDERIVVLLNEVDPLAIPVSMESYRESASAGGQRLVAEEGGEIVGHGQLNHAWWTGNPHIQQIEIGVAPAHRGRGIGSALHEALLERARQMETERLLGWVWQHSEAAMAFAAHRGFRATGVVLEDSRLDTREIDLAGYEGLEMRLQNEGIRIVRLAEIEANDDFLRKLQHMNREVNTEEEGSLSLEDWRREVLEAPGLSPEWHWVAMHGDRPVGLAYLKRHGDMVAESDFTGVAPAYQGRGIARALKWRTIRWARDHGVTFIYTCSEIENSRMLDINYRLGYRPLGRRVEMASDLQLVDIGSEQT